MVLEYLPTNPYLRTLVIIIGVMVLAKIAGSILKLIFKNLADVRGISPKGLRLNRFEVAVMLAIILWGVRVSLDSFSLSATISQATFNIITSLIVLNFGQLIVGIVRILIELFIHPYVKGTETKVDDQILSLIHRTSTIVIYLLAVLYVLTVWGVEIGPLIASLGIAGLAVALALQPTLANVFSGIAMFIDKTFEIGDIITVDGMTGTIHDLGLRTTRIKTFDNKINIIPNSILANQRIENRNKPDRTIRVDIVFGVAYGNDPEYIKKIVLEEMEELPLRDESKRPEIFFKDMGASSLDFKVMVWVDDLSKQWTTHQEAMTRIYRRLYKEDIEIPYPQSTVWIRDEGKFKSPSPQSRKFSSVHGKYFNDWGYEYKEEKKVAAQAKKRLSGSVLRRASKVKKKLLRKK